MNQSNPIWSNGPSNQEWYLGSEAGKRLVALANENGVDARGVHDDPRSVAAMLLSLVNDDDREWLVSTFEMGAV